MCEEKCGNAKGLFTGLISKLAPDFVLQETVDRRATQATEKGLTLIGNPTGEQENNRKYHHYLFNACGHTQNIDASLVKSGKFKCRQCEDDYLRAEAQSVGLTLLERAHTGTSSKYRFNDCGHEQRFGYTAVRRKGVRCKTCYYNGSSKEENRVKNAASAGLTFIQVTDVLSKGLYEDSECGHKFEYQISAVTALLKKGFRPRCPVCFENSKQKALIDNNLQLISTTGEMITFSYIQCGHVTSQSLHVVKTNGVKPCSVCKGVELKERIEALGVTLIDTELSPSRAPYSAKWNTCGHPISVSTGHLRYCNIPSCRICYDDNLVATAAKYNISLTRGSNKSTRHRLGTFNSCGHLREFEIQNLLQDNRESYFCQQCADNRKASEAVTSGLELVGKALNLDPNYRQYKTGCCLTLQDIQYNHVKENSWTCYSCQSNQFTKPSNIYLLKLSLDNFNWLKLGFAKDVQDRITGYNLDPLTTVEVLKVVQFETGLQAVREEKRIHKKMKSVRLDPSAMMKYKTSGYTECYPIETEHVLMFELEKLDNAKQAINNTT